MFLWRVIVLFAMFVSCLAFPSEKVERPDYEDDKMREDIQKEDVVSDANRAFVKRGAVIQSRNRWDTTNEGGKNIVKIPYTVAYGISSEARTALKRAIEELNQKTCVRFRPGAGGDHYARFVLGVGCSSDIGRRDGGQDVILAEGCQYKELILHELMHLLGFYHEHNRDDRDHYITIYEDNIKDGFKSDILDKNSRMDKQGIPYDLESILQYSKTKFAKPGLITMEAKNNPNKKLGNTHLSPLDIKRVNKLYGCSEQSNVYQDYEVTVKTGNGYGDGTDAFLFLELIAGDRKSGESEAATGGTHDDFESGGTDRFTVVFKSVPTPITQLKVRLEENPDGGYFQGWTMDSITIKDGQRTYTFNGPKDLYPGDSVTLSAS